jgi:hypothetical protein
MKLFKTMCARDCPDACWLDVTVENDTITQVIASTENPFTNGITCPRAAAPGTPQKIGGGPIFNSVKVRFRQ